jgi:hydroxymethylglutaryl-CoA reductase (NADPH)
MNLRDFNNWKDRNTALEKEIGSSFQTIASTFSDESENVHCENLIGAVALPLGVAGPLKINGEKVKNDVYIPLATTEGALVASVNRGCKAVSEGSGVTIITDLVGTTRGPVFKTKGIQESRTVREWVQEHFDEVATQAEMSSNHLKLLQIETAMEGRYLYLRCMYDTQDAMGMNMVTIATDMLSQYIELKTGAKLLSVAGNFDVDKKPSFMNILEGRGRKGWGETILSKDIVSSVLKTEPAKIVEALANIDEQITVADLKVPQGVTVLTDATQVVARIGEMMKEEEPAPTDEVALPEVIGEKPAEGEETATEETTEEKK